MAARNSKTYIDEGTTTTLKEEINHDHPPMKVYIMGSYTFFLFAFYFFRKVKTDTTIQVATAVNHFVTY